MFIKGYLGRKTNLPVRGNSEINKHYRKLNLTTQVTIAAKIHLITMQFFFLGVKNGLPWRCQCWKHVKKTYQYFQINFRKSRCLHARHKWNQTHGEKETLFQKFFHFPFVLAACLTFWVLEEFFNILEKQIFPRYEIQMFEMENCTRLAD